MRIFLLWPDKRAELVTLLRALNTSPHELVYWMGQVGTESMNQPGTIFHSHLDAIDGIPPKGIDASKYDPPSAELIEKMRKTESIVVTMLDRTMNGKSVGERRHFYYELLGFWVGMFKEYKPEVLIFPVEPHGAHDYIPYEL